MPGNQGQPANKDDTEKPEHDGDDQRGNGPEDDGGDAILCAGSHRTTSWLRLTNRTRVISKKEMIRSNRPMAKSALFQVVPGIVSPMSLKISTVRVEVPPKSDVGKLGMAPMTMATAR